MTSIDNPWQLLRQQLMQTEPSAPLQIDDTSIHVNHDHWIELNIEVSMPGKSNDKAGHAICVTGGIGSKFGRHIIITNIVSRNGSQPSTDLRPFDIILAFDGIDFTDVTRETARHIMLAHQGKIIQMRVRRLQPLVLEQIEFNFSNNIGINKPHKFGFLIDGGWNENYNDPGLFVIGIKPKGRAAHNGRLRIGDRLMQISNMHTTINLQCVQLDDALRLVKRMRSESTRLTLVVAHQTKN